MRRLRADEVALWAHVTASVRRAGVKQHPAPIPREGERPVGKPSPGLDPSLRKGTVRSNTLDSTWDRNLATGRVAPDRTIDLHGCTLASAHTRLDAGLAAAVENGERLILLVTGRAPRAAASRLDLPMRGIIRASIGDWLAASRHAGDIAAIRPAHLRHGGGGALYLVMRRRR